jgi:hypothetical protein
VLRTLADVPSDPATGAFADPVAIEDQTFEVAGAEVSVLIASLEYERTKMVPGLEPSPEMRDRNSQRRQR